MILLIVNNFLLRVIILLILINGIFQKKKIWSLGVVGHPQGPCGGFGHPQELAVASATPD
jgi:hypothetical protein